jgi:hypothetical protein
VENYLSSHWGWEWGGGGGRWVKEKRNKERLEKERLKDEIKVGGGKGYKTVANFLADRIRKYLGS